MFRLKVYSLLLQVGGRYIVSDDVTIQDWPQFPHRGISLDTARNFVSVPTLKKVGVSISIFVLSSVLLSPR